MDLWIEVGAAILLMVPGERVILAVAQDCGRLSDEPFEPFESPEWL